MSSLSSLHRESPLDHFMLCSFRDNKGVGSRFWPAHRKLRLPTLSHRLVDYDGPSAG